jgi:hypothetical protein
MERQREDGQTAARRRVTVSGPRERHTTLVPRATRQFPAIEDLADSADSPAPRPTSPSTALTPYTSPRAEESAPVIVAPRPTRALTAAITPRSEPTIKPWMRLTAGLIAIVACIVGVLGFQLIHPAAIGDKASGASSASVTGTPEPSGRGPITASIGVIVAMPAPKAQHSTQSTGPTPSGSGNYIAYGITSIMPCHDSVKFVANISQWTVPPGCYANIYKPNPANYPSRASWGYCNWWVEESHPQDPNVTGATSYRRGTVPVANAAVFIDGGEQGAGPEGHWVESVAVSSDGYWILISEMNFAWRGAGWGLVDYRYIHVSPHVHFLYGV